MKSNNTDSKWVITEEMMKDKGVYIIGMHPLKGGFIIVHGDRDAKEEITNITNEMMKACRNNKNNKKPKKS